MGFLVNFPVGAKREAALRCAHERTTPARRRHHVPGPRGEGPDVRRSLLHRRDDDRHLLPHDVHREETPTGECGVLSHRARGPSRRLPAVPRLPPCRAPGEHARAGPPAPLGGRGRPGAAPQGRGPALPGNRPCRPAPVVQEEPRDDVPGVRQDAADRRGFRPDQARRHRHERRLRPRVGLPFRLRRCVPQGHGRRADARDGARCHHDADRDADRTAARRRDRSRHLPARVRRPADDRDPDPPAEEAAARHARAGDEPPLRHDVG